METKIFSMGYPLSNERVTRYPMNPLAGKKRLCTKKLTMEHLTDSIKNFITALPPMLQLLFGLFATLGVIKLFMLVVDFIEDRREEKS